MISKTAKDLLVPLDNYPYAYGTQTLREAVELLETSQIEFDGRMSMPRVLLVFDANNQLLGMARRRDILRGLEPEFHGELDTTHPEAHFKSDVDPHLSDLIPLVDPQRLQRKLEKPLADVVHELNGRVDIDDSLMKVIRELVGKDTHIAVVLDGGKVVGVVRSLDVLRAVYNELS